MLERLFDSQSGILCIGGMFEMVKTIAFLRNLPDKGLIATEDFTREPNLLSDSNTVGIRAQLLSSFFNCLMIPALLDYEGAETDGNKITYGLSAEDVFVAADVICRHTPASDIGGLMQSIGHHLEREVFAAKWTLCHRYAPVFLDTSDTYWIEIVRNPYARISSGQRYGFDELGHTSLAITRDALRFSRDFKHDRYLLLRYEDLCTEPVRELERVSNWLGYEILNRDITNPVGGAFRGNSSDNLLSGKPAWYQDASIAPQVGALDLDRWRDHLSRAEIEVINLALDFADLYPMEHGTGFDRVRALSKYTSIKAYSSLRLALKAVLGMVGLDIVRKRRSAHI